LQKGLIGIYWLVFSLGVWVENPSAERLISIVGLGLLCFFAMSSTQLSAIQSRRRISTLLWIMAPITLLFLEKLSKYSINDFFHMLYFVILLNLYQSKEVNRFRGIAGLGGLALSWKYVYIAIVSPSLFKLPQVIVGISLYFLVAITLWLTLKLYKKQLEMQVLNQTLEDRQDILTQANQRLETLMQEVETLTIFKERQRLAREIHDAVGHELTALTMKLELSKYYFANDQDQGHLLLEEGIQDSRNALKSTRQVVETLTNDRRSAGDLIQLIKKVDQTAHMQIQIEGQESLESLTVEQTHVTYRAIQEGITNCMKHSNAKHLWIELKLEGAYFILNIKDDGNALSSGAKIHEGYGLNGMRARVKELGGLFKYEVLDGFCLSIQFRVERCL
jgi:signal transduction histidine kinase